MAVVETYVSDRGRLSRRVITSDDVALRREQQRQQGHAASDTEMCGRCHSTARYTNSIGDPHCPRCGLLVRCREVKGDAIIDLGFHPVAHERTTGYYIENGHPAAGYREPAWLWIGGDHRDD